MKFVFFLSFIGCSHPLPEMPSPPPSPIIQQVDRTAFLEKTISEITVRENIEGWEKKIPVLEILPHLLPGQKRPMEETPKWKLILKDAQGNTVKEVMVFEAGDWGYDEEILGRSADLVIALENLKPVSENITTEDPITQ